MFGGVERVLRLAGKHYVTSLALWLLTAPFMIGGLLFTELHGPWSTANVFAMVLAGATGHLALGAVLFAARFLVFPTVSATRTFGWWVGGTVVFAGGVRGTTVGLVAETTAVGDLTLAVRIPTSVALIAFSFPLVAYSLQLWGDYRHKRDELLLSLLVTDAALHQPNTAALKVRAQVADNVARSIEAAREDTLTSLRVIRRAIASGSLRADSVGDILQSTDRAWRASSHDAWDSGLPKIPRITPIELLRTWSSSHPFSMVVLAVGPLYGLGRTLEALAVTERWVIFGVWLVAALALGAAANGLANRAGLVGPFVLLVALLFLQALPVVLGQLIAGDSALLLQLWFVGFVSSSTSLVFGFPPALERQGQRVIEQLAKWVDRATLDALRRQGEDILVAQRIAHFLHSEVRGYFLQFSLALRVAIEQDDYREALRVVDELHTLVTQFTPNSVPVSAQDNLTEFLANWAQMVHLTHNLDTVSLPPPVAIAAEAIVMEAVNDAVRHAHATTIDVAIAHNGDDYDLAVTSNGEPPQSSFSAGLGTRILNTYAHGRWIREAQVSGGNVLRLTLGTQRHTR